MDVFIILVDENVKTIEQSLFKTVTTLTDYIKDRINAEQ